MSKPGSLGRQNSVRNSAACALLLMLGLAASPAQAWGPHGHQLVATIAADALQPKARREVERLLGDRADLAMREASTWPDTIRDQPRYRDTGPWHYNNFPRSQCQFRRQRDCRAGRCLVAAIERFVAVLADPKLEDRKRAEALRFLIHFVGDIHQPLHAGWGDDRGGNDFQVRVGRSGRNLHSLWDDYLLRQAGLGLAAHRERLTRLPLGSVPARISHATPTADAEPLAVARRAPSIRLNVPSSTSSPSLSPRSAPQRRLGALATDRCEKCGLATWDGAAPERWVEESCRVIALGVYPRSPSIDAAYVGAMLPLAEARVALAGRRLAALLNALLAAGE